MGKRPILKSAIIISLVVELVLIILVYNKVGGDRLPAQITRLFFQLVFISLILFRRSNTGLLLLVAYHIVSALYGIYSRVSLELLGQILIGYHFIIGLVLYFHDWMEHKLGLNNIKPK